ncbi:acyl transferase/acyl hydrolase/lysophospholipase [Radiomyces spectabilis]|uniref:acyl transferase/acyl hydrolase/lysophospholipase n=1 Tax=Radiomyces spectabilis TaxID=64574 RepID=UPI00222063AC|nr:acyl transferase/acyl hydrolase/lysophospholipase [Radiomyces spectabilis]KAI8371450.1 acyl transferase/acyl hydrolase/lysophospholipase [Radiomyces spectabilis]
MNESRKRATNGSSLETEYQNGDLAGTGPAQPHHKDFFHPHEFELEHVNEEHVADFVRALAYDPLSGSESTAEYISASSEFIPLRGTSEKKKKSRRRTRDPDSKPRGISYTLLQYPLMFGICAVIFTELLLYLGLRQTVRLWESTFSWRGKRGRLRNALRAATTYEEWCRAADALDRYMGKDRWKETAAYGFYDYRLIQKVVRSLRQFRKSEKAEDASMLKDVLYACLKQNFSGIENTKLYSNTYHGTKRLVEEYVEEVTQAIDALVVNPHISSEEKRLAFKLYAKNYGRTAFCLSGGAGFGYFHLGVIRALLDQNLLPAIITGTSAGSLMGAIVCTRTDEELRQVLTPELAERIRICQDSWFVKLRRYASTGALFDSEQWCREAMWFCRGSLTFKEAYERTGRIFNVSVIPFDPHSPPKLLNYITAPNCVIWSAILASAAIPGILNPVVLMQKVAKSKHLIPYNYGHKFKDGSLRTDIPTQALHNHFNVNYTVVSQVNPHVHIFFYANQGSPGRPVTHRAGTGWRGGFLASTIEQILKLDLSKWLKVLRDLDLLPKLLEQDWSSIWLQKFDGNVTILPKAGLSDWLYTMADPDEKRLTKLMLSGRQRTWPKVSMIANRLRIESAITKARRDLLVVHRMSRKAKRDKSDLEIELLRKQVDDKERVYSAGGTTSDDASGSGDERQFLTGHRTDSPEAMDKATQKEQDRRRKFLAQFTDRRQVIGGEEITAQQPESMKEKEQEEFEEDVEDEGDESDDDMDEL